MSNVGRWAPWYDRGAVDYGDTVTYRLAAEWLAGLAVEDWGCGCARFRDLHRGPYVGVDGTAGFCDVVDDLEQRRSDTAGLLMRHVLEHNEQWRKVLANAVVSARQRLVVVVFTPDGAGERIGWTDELGVPDLALPHAAIDAALDGWDFTRLGVATPTYYGIETIWRAAWPGPASAL